MHTYFALNIVFIIIDSVYYYSSARNIIFLALLCL